MMQEGKSMLEIIARLDTLRRHSLLMMTMPDLSFAVKSKKMSVSSGFIANLLGIKPVMWVNDDGVVVPRDKIRKVERSLHYMAETAIAHISNNPSFVYMVDTSMGFFTDSFQHLLANEYGLKNVPIVPVSTVSLAHHGPTALGLGVYHKEIPRITKYLT